MDKTLLLKYLTIPHIDDGSKDSLVTYFVWDGMVGWFISAGGGGGGVGKGIALKRPRIQKGIQTSKGLAAQVESLGNVGAKYRCSIWSTQRTCFHTEKK